MRGRWRRRKSKGKMDVRRKKKNEKMCSEKVRNRMDALTWETGQWRGAAAQEEKRGRKKSE